MQDNAGERILAKSLFRELRAHGYSAHQVLGLTNELIELVTIEIHERSVAAARSTEGADGADERDEPGAAVH